MAHELDYNAAAGRFNYVEFKRADERMVISAWHREGLAVPSMEGTAGEYQVQRALEVVQGDYVVEVRPTFYMGEDAEGAQEVRQSDTACITYRTDRGVNGVELARVGPKYAPLQNVDAMAPMIPLLDDDILRLECGGVLEGGKRMWMLAQWNFAKFGPVAQEVFEQEGIRRYAMFANSHDGTSAARYSDQEMRVVCANTWAAGDVELANTGRWRAVPHTGDAKLRAMDAAQDLWHSVIERAEQAAAGYRLMRQRILTDVEFIRLVLDYAVPDPRKSARFNPEARLAPMVVERADRRRAAISTLWESGIGHRADHSAWEAFQAVTQAVDHHNDLFPVRAGTYRTAHLLGGRLQKIKGAVFDRLMRVSGGGMVDDGAEAEYAGEELSTAE